MGCSSSSCGSVAGCTSVRAERPQILAAPEPDNDEEVTSDSPPIVAETKAMIPECSVADAVMLLDLQNANGLLFKNAGSGAHNMVYRRHDGSIGWVEPR